jgi:death-on-curing protein
MSEPIWINKSTVIITHNFLIDRHGGSHGIRDEALLDSALAKPINLYAYEQGDIYDMAASYSYGIAKNHPFIDGNKRTAFMTAYTFLGLNGLLLEVTDGEAVVMTVALANGEMPVEGYTQWLRDNCKPIDKK